MKLRIGTLCALFLISLCNLNPARGQSAENVSPTSSILNPQELSPLEASPRVTSAVDDSKFVKMGGNTHPMARAEFDRGPVDPGLPMERMILVLDRSQEQEAALQKFMDRQLNPASPDYHRWLEPKDFGAHFGPTNSDIQAVSSWLESRGFTVDKVAAGRVFLEFSGTARMVEQAFHTSMHRYNVNGEEHISNDTDPSIPEALRPVVAGIVSLNDFHSTAMHIDMGSVRRDPETGKWSPLATDGSVHPLDGVSNGGINFEMVSPYDFAAIYNVAPLWDAKIDGTGVTIAIAGRSNVSLADVAKFRSAFGLPAKAPTIFLNGTDPGLANANDRLENTIDVEWSGAVAKGATIKLVTTANTATTDGAVVSAMYIVDHNVAPVMSFSYGQCELYMGTTKNTAINKMWQQGAAEGISIFVSSGDSAAAGCDVAFTSPHVTGQGLAVNGLASTPYNVAVGGTDLLWANLTTVYWNKTNAANGSSALGYIPEVPWNSSCASDDIDKFIGLFKQGYGEEASCNYILTNTFDTFALTMTGGGGGVSACTAPTGATAAKCAGGYGKPAWQAGTGVPADKKRDVPDLALFASNGAMNSAYLTCDSATTPCTFTKAANTVAQAVGGTSVASPAMAGIMALVLQKAGGTPQGLPNPVFYKLATKEAANSCGSLAIQAGNSCVFQDISEDNNAIPCGVGTLDCTVTVKTDKIGILTGYKAKKGYDQATGLGSVNANNLVNGWNAVAPAAAVTIKPAIVTFPSTLVGKSAPAQTVTVKNTGAGWLNFAGSGVSVLGTDFKSFPAITTCDAPIAPGADCTAIITFTPKSGGTLTSNLQIGDNAPKSPQIVALTGTGSVVKPIVVTLSQTSLAFIYTTVGTTSGYDSFSATNTSASAINVNPITIGGAGASSYSQLNTCGSSLAAGASCWVYVVFKPVTDGDLPASLSFSDSADSAPLVVALDGSGEPAPTVTLVPASVTFAATAVGTLAPPQTVTLTNTGTWLLQVQIIQIVGAGSPSFYEFDDCQNYGYLSREQSCTIEVAFQPAATGTQQATMYIVDNAGGTVQAVPLTGTGK